MRLKAWSLLDWQADKSPWTVWVIRDSLLNTGESDKLVKAATDSGVEIISLIADEAHVAFRTMDSMRAVAFKRIAAVSQFVGFVSGTLFPLGASSDGKGLLECLGGGWAPGTVSKWKPAQRTQLQHLFLNPRSWNILAFRRLITPFYLCRHIDATWQGRYIIPRSRRRPVPEVVIPKDDALESRLTQEFETLRLERNRDGGVNLLAARLRTDQLKMLAWCPLYKDCRFATNPQRQHFIHEKWTTAHITSRMQDLIDEIKGIHAAEERFIICSESIFLMILAVHVKSPKN
jgi:hypothetical protein